MGLSKLLSWGDERLASWQIYHSIEAHALEGSFNLKRCDMVCICY